VDRGLIELKIATMFGGARLNEALVLSVLGDGRFYRHAEAVRTRLERARRSVGEQLREIGITPWLEPRAGMFLWCSLPQGRDSAALARAALADGVVLAPGNAFSAAQTAGNFMRFNVAQMDAGSFAVLRRLL
jgi:DNA-binding transcriptional MocR family regulator